MLPKSFIEDKHEYIEKRMDEAFKKDNLKIAVESEYGTDHVPNTVGVKNPIIIKHLYDEFADFDKLDVYCKKDVPMEQALNHVQMKSLATPDLDRFDDLIKQTLNHEQMKSLIMQDTMKGGVGVDAPNTKDRYILDDDGMGIINPDFIPPHHIHIGIKPIFDTKDLKKRIHETFKSFIKRRDERIESILTSAWDHLEIPNKKIITHINQKHALEFICAKKGVPMTGKAIPEFDKSNYEFVIKKPLDDNITIVSWKSK